jgi:hypothetical protein
MTDAETRLAKGGFEIAWLASPLAMTELRAFIKNLVGVESVSSLTKRKHPTELFRYSCGATKKSWRKFHKAARIDPKIDRFVTTRVLKEKFVPSALVDSL